MEFWCIILFGAVFLAIAAIFVASLFYAVDEKKTGRISGKIVAVIGDEENIPVEYAVKELVYTVQRLSDKGIDLDVYVVNNSKNKETQKLLEILNRELYRIHIIENPWDNTKTKQEILHIEEE